MRENKQRKHRREREEEERRLGGEEREEGMEWKTRPVFLGGLRRLLRLRGFSGPSWS